MKHYLCLALLFILFTGCSNIRVGDTPARRIAKDRSIPGKGMQGQCPPYAQALHDRFTAAGIPSKIVKYDFTGIEVGWRSACTRQSAHAVVFYDDQGRTYCQDAYHWLPEWLPDASAGSVQQFTSPQVWTTVRE